MTPSEDRGSIYIPVISPNASPEPTIYLTYSQNQLQSPSRHIANLSSLTSTMTATTLLYSQLCQTITPPSVSDFRKQSGVTVRKLPTDFSPKPIVSPLLALPLELRLQIYTHAVTLHMPDSPKIATSDHTPLFPDHISTSLLLVNRQIYHEARLLPLSSNTFVFTKCFGSSVYSARKFLTRLEDWQREALRNVVIAIVGREIVESWRREEGWENVIAMLSQCKNLSVKVKIQEGDVWIGNGKTGIAAFMAYGGNVGPGIATQWGIVMPVCSKTKDGWMQRLLESAGRGNGVRLQFEWCEIPF